MNKWLFIAEAEPSTAYGTILFVTLSFLLLVVLIKHFAWDNIAQVLNERAKKISDDIDQAEAARINALSLEKKREKALAEAQGEAQEVLVQAKLLSEKNSQAVLEEAYERASQIQKQAEQNIQAETEKAYHALQADIAALSVELAGKILQEELTPEKHEDMIESFIERLDRHDDKQ